jgi:hypothetical protein
MSGSKKAGIVTIEIPPDPPPPPPKVVVLLNCEFPPDPPAPPPPMHNICTMLMPRGFVQVYQFWLTPLVAFIVNTAGFDVALVARFNMSNIIISLP